MKAEDDLYQIKEALAAKFGFELRAIVRDLQRGERESEAEGYRFFSPPSKEWPLTAAPEASVDTVINR